MTLHTQSVTVGPIETNCYFVFDDARKLLYVIDPGDEPEKLVETAAKYPFEHCVVLLTHAHADHISGLPGFAKSIHVDRVCLRSEDEFIYDNPANALRPYLEHPKNLPHTEAPVPDGNFTVLELPGHTPGGAGYRFEALRTVFAGDTIFRASVGRTDLPGGDDQALANSIRRELYTLPDETRLCCGHGSETSVGFEKDNNPYVN